MKFRLIIDNTKEEQILATVHARSPLTDRIEAMVQQYSGDDRVAAYTEDDMCFLPFTQIECVTVLDGKTYAIDRSGKRFRLLRELPHR